MAITTNIAIIMKSTVMGNREALVGPIDLDHVITWCIFLVANFEELMKISKRSTRPW